MFILYFYLIILKKIKLFVSECSQLPLFSAPLDFEKLTSHLRPCKGIQSLCLCYNSASSCLCNSSHTLVSLEQRYFYSDSSLILVARSLVPSFLLQKIIFTLNPQIHYLDSFATGYKPLNFTDRLNT